MSRARPPILVVGAGAAGMLAALALARRGVDVRLIEHDLAGRSNLLVSGGLFPIANSRFQREAGIDDSAALLASDIRAKAAGTANEAIVDAVAASGPTVLAVMDAIGLPVHLAATVPAPGASVPRLHATPQESGRELHALLRAAVAREQRIEMLDRTSVLALVAHAGRVIGAELRGDAGPRRVDASAVLLATGGFAGNRDLLGEFIPEMRDAIHIGAGPNDGLAIRLGRAVGADVAMMDGYQGQGHVNRGGRTRLGMGLPLLGAFMVNRAGERFVREDIGPSDLGRHVLAQAGGVALEIYDERCHQAAMRQGPYREAFEAGEVFAAGSIDEIAARAAIDVARLQRSFDEYGAAARGERADALGRTKFGPTLAAPFYAAWVTGAMAHTQGGLRVNAHAQACRADGTAIEGLYAAGGAAAGLAGRGGEGYLPGNGLGQSFGLAVLAAQHIAQR